MAIDFATAAIVIGVVISLILYNQLRRQKQLTLAEGRWSGYEFLPCHRPLCTDYMMGEEFFANEYYDCN